MSGASTSAPRQRWSTRRHLFTDEHELGRAFKASSTHLVSVLFFSCAINLLYLAPSLYMLQVYDRVLANGSAPTLVMLTVLLAVSVLVLALLDALRAHILTKAGLRLDRLLSPRVMAAALRSAPGLSNSQTLRDLDLLRGVVTGPSIHAVFDLPWTPLFVVVIFLVHPALGWFAVAAVAVLLALAVLNETWVSAPLARASAAQLRSYAASEASLRNREVITALGMMGGLLTRWSADRTEMLRLHRSAADRTASLQAMIRSVRLMAQSLILGLGAYLVIERQITAGGIIAVTILLGRALQPVEQVVGAWRGLNAARDSHARLVDGLLKTPAAPEKLRLPRPIGTVLVDNVGLALPGSHKPILHGVSFAIGAGEVVGVIGPSGAGKSTLARLMLGLTTPTIGSVRLDHADVASWPRDQIGPYLGYLPQDVELFSVSVADNIRRLSGGSDGLVIEAARLAGVHDTILGLPDGYDTIIDQDGTLLSGGARQRIGLARAVYGDPALVILDEPSSHLDGDGDAALVQCILDLKAKGTTVVVISHRPHTVAVADRILVLRGGTVDLYGTRADVLARLSRPKVVASGPSQQGLVR